MREDEAMDLAFIAPCPACQMLAVWYCRPGRLIPSTDARQPDTYKPGWSEPICPTCIAAEPTEVAA